MDTTTVLLARDHHGAYVHDPPAFEDRQGMANPVVGLDATAREQLWQLAVGQPVETTHIHDSTEKRREFLRDVMNLQVIQTSPDMQFYEGSTGSKRFDGDVALVKGVEEEFAGERIRSDKIATVGKPGVISTKCVRREIEPRLKGHVSAFDNYGNVTGSNALGPCRLGVVLGTQHFGNKHAEKWAALGGEQVANPGTGTALDYDSEIANTYLNHMSEDQTMQAVLRFGRDEGGALVFVHSAPLREGLPVVGDGEIVTAHSKGKVAVRNALLPYLRAGESFTVTDLTEKVEYGRRTVQRALAEFTDLGYLERHDPGVGRANEFRAVADPETGQVTLPGTVEPPTPETPDLNEESTGDADRSYVEVHYTGFVGGRGPDDRRSRSRSSSQAVLPAPPPETEG